MYNKKKIIKNNSGITAEQMYKIENNGHNKFGMLKNYMMENAGHCLADFVYKKYIKNFKKIRIVIICGSGNNGGDGMVAARHLSSRSNNHITVIFLGNPDLIKTEESKINWNILQKMNSIHKIILNKNTVNENIRNTIQKADIILDGIFGTGIKGEIKEPHKEIIEIINSTKAYIVAIDIPSGLDPNIGNIRNSLCIKANTTITFHRIKKGLINQKKYTGKIIIKNIGIPLEAEEGIINEQF